MASSESQLSIQSFPINLVLEALQAIDSRKGVGEDKLDPFYLNLLHL